MELVKIDNSEFKKVVDDAAGKSQEISGEATQDDQISGELYQTPGVYSVPPKESVGAFCDLGTRGQGIFIAVNNYKLDFDLKKGEIKIYSTNDGGDTLKASIYFKDDGNLVINDGADNAVRYSELETAFNQLKSDRDDLSTKFNALLNVVKTWTVTPTDGGAALKAAAASLLSSSASTADISGAKIDEVLVP